MINSSYILGLGANVNMSGGRPSKYEPQFCQMLVDHMRKGRSFPAFGAVIEVSMDTLYEWAKVHPAFSEAKSLGRTLELSWWENILRAGAAGRIANYNATSTIFALKNKAPREWRDRIQVDANISADKTKEGIKRLIENPEYREAALVIAEALANEKIQDESGE